MLFLLRYLLFSFLCSQIVFSCPEGSVEWKNYCYIFNATLTGFAKAETICVKNGGHLVSIHDAFLNAIIGQYAPDYFNQDSKTPNFWIGLNSLKSQNIWEWTDESNFDFNDWSKGKPQNSSDSYCVSASMIDGYWRNESCFSLKPFVCGTEKNDSQTTATTNITQWTSTTTSLPPYEHSLIANCSNGWTHFNYTNSSYCTFFKKNSWQDAEDYCKNLGAHLTSINSKEENEFIYNTIGFYCYAPWIGLHTIDNGTSWQWSDNSKFEYFVWRTNPPNISEGKCAVLGGICGHPVGEFVNTECDHNIPFIVMCKKND